MESAYGQAMEKAAEKVLLSIAESGAPTEAQLKFLKMARGSPSDLDDIAKAFSILDKFFGISEAAK